MPRRLCGVALLLAAVGIGGCLIEPKDYPLERLRPNVGEEAGASGDNSLAGEGGDTDVKGSTSGDTGAADAGSGGTSGAVDGSCGHVGKAGVLAFLGATDYVAGTSPSAVAEGD